MWCCGDTLVCELAEYSRKYVGLMHDNLCTSCVCFQRGFWMYVSGSLVCCACQKTVRCSVYTFFKFMYGILSECVCVLLIGSVVRVLSGGVCVYYVVKVTITDFTVHYQ